MAEPLRKQKTKARSPRSKISKLALPQPEINIPASQKPLTAADIGVDYDQFKQRYVENQRAQSAMGASRPKAIPAPLLGLALGVGAAATAHYFWRKHKSKSGKMITERVRRK